MRITEAFHDRFVLSFEVFPPKSEAGLERLCGADGGVLTALCAAISALTDAEVDSLVTKCLRFCCKKMKLGWAACVDAEGRYGVAELSHDPVTALALCAEALKWGLGDFFGESASSLLGALFAPSSPRRP